MLLEDERYLLKWLSQYGAMTRTQAIKMLRKTEEKTAEKIIRNLVREQRIAELCKGEILAMDELCKVNNKTVIALWVMLQFIDKVNPLDHYPATHPAQLFFLKEKVGYEVAVLFEGEEYLATLLHQSGADKYIIVVENVGMIARVSLPDAPCVFAIVEYQENAEPIVRFFTESTEDE